MTLRILVVGSCQKIPCNTFKVAEVAGLGQRQWEAVCSEASPGDDDDCMVMVVMLMVLMMTMI